LTGLYNRRVFYEKLSDELDQCKKKKKVVSLLMLDLDGFKEFNDTQGHQAGDLILQEFAGILKTELRESDIVARYGGDEIMVILRSVDKLYARKIGDKLREKIEEEFKKINITVSGGISEFPSDGKKCDDMISQTDEALYRAKEFGGNKIVYFKPVEVSYQPITGGTAEVIKKVACVGDFNRWNKKFGMMKYSQSGESKKWNVVLNLKPGRYRYKFLINGTKWISDPKSTEFVEDGFSGQCSILTVPLE